MSGRRFVVVAASALIVCVVARNARTRRGGMWLLCRSDGVARYCYGARCEGSLVPRALQLQIAVRSQGVDCFWRYAMRGGLFLSYSPLLSCCGRYDTEQTWTAPGLTSVLQTASNFSQPEFSPRRLRKFRYGRPFSPLNREESISAVTNSEKRASGHGQEKSTQRQERQQGARAA